MENKNIWQLIVRDEMLDVMRLLGCDQKYLGSEASDFEKFREWIAAYPYMIGNTAAINAAERIGCLLGRDITASDLCYADAREIWRRFEDVKKGEESRSDNIKKSDEKSYCDFSFDFVFDSDEKDKILRDGVDLDAALECERNTGNGTFGKFIESLEFKRDNYFGFKVYPCEFNRPNRYHAEEYYSEYIRDGIYKYDKINFIMSQAICELIYCEKCGIIYLRLAENESIKWAEEFIKYLSVRDLSVRVLLFVNEKNTPQEIREVCLCGRKVIPVLPYSGVEYLESFAKVFPMGAVLIDEK